MGRLAGKKSPFRHHKFDCDCLKDKKVGVNLQEKDMFNSIY